MKTVKCTDCKKTVKHYAKGMCQKCYSRSLYKAHGKPNAAKNQRTYYKNNAEKIKERARNKYREDKKKQALFTKRIKRALIKAGYTEKKIITFFGVK